MSDLKFLLRHELNKWLDMVYHLPNKQLEILKFFYYLFLSYFKKICYEEKFDQTIQHDQVNQIRE